VTKSGGSEARKPRSLKSGGGLKPSSLIEVYAYDTIPASFIDPEKMKG